MSRWAQAVFRVGGSSLSAPQTAAYFAARNGITTAPVTTAPVTPAAPATPALTAASPFTNARRGRSGTAVERTQYSEAGRPPVTLYTIHGGGHTVPGPRRAPAILGRTSQDVSAAGLADDFFGLSAIPR